MLLLLPIGKPGHGHRRSSSSLRGGSWNTVFFRLKDGACIHSLKTETRVARARFTADGRRLLLGGMKSQPGFDKECKIPEWGHVDVYELAR